MAKIDPDAAALRVGSSYPSPVDEPCQERKRWRLGDLVGLTQFGVNLLRLPPGTWSSQRHWHWRAVCPRSGSARCALRAAPP